MKTTMHLDILYNLEILGFFFLTLTWIISITSIDAINIILCKKISQALLYHVVNYLYIF